MGLDLVLVRGGGDVGGSWSNFGVSGILEFCGFQQILESRDRFEILETSFGSGFR